MGHTTSLWSFLQVLRSSLSSMESEAFDKTLVTLENLPMRQRCWRNHLSHFQFCRVFTVLTFKLTTWNFNSYHHTWNVTCVTEKLLVLFHFNWVLDWLKLIINRHMWLVATTLGSTVLECKDEKDTIFPFLAVSCIAVCWPDFSFISIFCSYAYVPGTTCSPGC